MIRVEQALKAVLENIRPLPCEEVRLLDSLDRVLAVDIYSDVNIPGFDNSAMDGYAVVASDLAGASQENPVLLDMVGDLPAGIAEKLRIERGQCARIMTGAPIPDGADSVVMVEKTQLEGRKVKIFESTKSGKNIRRAGEDIKKGELVIKKGQIISPAQMGILANLGLETIKVVKTPRVGILATGDELVEVKETIGPGKIRNSNTYSLFGQIKEAGGMPCILGIARDNKKEIRAKIEEGLSYDLLLISGGVSVGDYDYVKDVLLEMGADIKFWKVAMRPGKPLAFGIIKDKPIFGLPGNPVSSMVGFEIFVRPAILSMLGQTILSMLGQNANSRKEAEAVLEEDINKKEGLRYFLRAVTHWQDGCYFTKTTGPQGSAILKSMSLANSLIVLSEEDEVIKKGRKVSVKFID